MSVEFTVQVQPDQGEEKEERPAVKIEVKADSLLDLVAGAVPAEVTRHGGLIMETPFPALI